MKLCRFGDHRLGVVEGDQVRDVTAALDVLPQYRYPFPGHDVFIANIDKVAARARSIVMAAPAVPLEGLALRSPVANPGKLIGAPVNYQKHLTEVRTDVALHNNNTGHMLTIQSAGLFLKANSSLIGPGDDIVISRDDRRTDHEVELAFVIGRTAKSVPAAEGLQYVAGYTIGLDITIRGSEDRSFRKSPDSYSVPGPWLVTADEIPDPGSLDLEITVNGETRQKSNTRNLILGVAELVALASSFYTLHPGDVIFTGTPEGVAPIEPGDRIVATVERIGTMALGVRRADTAPAAAMTGAVTARP